MESKLKNWLLANNFILDKQKNAEHYSIVLNTRKTVDGSGEIKLRLIIIIIKNKIVMFLSNLMIWSYDTKEKDIILLFETDDEDKIDKYWILDTIKFLRK